MPANPASFHRLSTVLVAQDVPADLAEAYFLRSQTALGDQLALVLERFDAAVGAGLDPVSVTRDVLLPDPALGPAARLILILWYTGAIQAGTDWILANADHFYRALVWDAIGAHPPTLSNGYYGHWKYPPERA